MTSILVWVLIASNTSYAGYVSYSPPVATLADCQRMQQAIPRNSQCVQINMVTK